MRRVSKLIYTFDLNTDCLNSCAIDWMPDKNVTMKLVKKKQKNKKEGSTRFVTKKVKADSFFNYFDPPAHHGDDSDEQLVSPAYIVVHESNDCARA